ncbi:MAG: metallophosphoesterase [Thermomicrobiales bacterium]
MSQHPDRHLPVGVDPARIVARVGLISDTHMPERCPAWPPGLFEVLRGVDLLLHAGDVGELWVLDQLGALAPVIAVHGNDDGADAWRELPYRQVVAVAGVRLVLTHGHYPERGEEMASHAIDDWGPKLDRLASFGASAGARVVVSGHTHIPVAHEHRGVLLVNPGAVAAGGSTSRQLYRTVAILFVRDDGALFVTHVDLAALERPFVATVDWEAGFRAAAAHYEQSILAPDLAARWGRLREIVVPFSREELRPVIAVLARCARRCWSGERELVTVDDLVTELARAVDLPTALREQLVVAMLPAAGEYNLR